MGASTSTQLGTEEIFEMQSVSHFTAKEIRKLYKRFKRLDKQEKGSISTDDLLSIPELSMNPLVGRIITIYDSRKDGQINFKQFIQTLSVFHPKAGREEKLKFAFQIYDINGDGNITPDELFSILKMMVGNNLSDEQIKMAVQETMREADKEKKGKISFKDFCDALENSDIHPKMSTRFFKIEY